MRDAASEGRTRVGLIAVILVLFVVFAAFRFALYTLERVYGISIPYPDITLTLIYALIALAGIWILGHTIQATASPLIGTKAASSARRIVTAALVLVTVFATLVNLHIDITGYLVSLGITAVVIGLAAQSTIGNLVAGMLVLISKPFRKGDYIRVNITGGPIEGTIDEISFLRSRMFTNDGVSISVPNTVMLTTPISNFTVYERRPIILAISLERKVSADDFRDKVEAALKNRVVEGETRVYVKGLDEKSMHIELWIPVATQNFLKERSLIVNSVKELCQRKGINLKQIELQS